MDLKSFVAETLTQVLGGIRKAQEDDGSGNIAPTLRNGEIGNKTNLFHHVTGIYTSVDFDVSIQAGETDTGTTLKVSSMEATDGSGRYNHNSSRVRFSVHMKLPSPNNRQT